MSSKQVSAGELLGWYVSPEKTLSLLAADFQKSSWLQVLGSVQVEESCEATTHGRYKACCSPQMRTHLGVLDLEGLMQFGKWIVTACIKCLAGSLDSVEELVQAVGDDSSGEVGALAGSVAGC